MITLKICQKQPFNITVMTPRGILGLCCVHIAQLETHSAVFTLPFYLVVMLEASCDTTENK